MCCCCRRLKGSTTCRDVTACVFSAVFYYVFLPAATVFQMVWAVGMSTGTIKDLHYMLTGNRSLEGVPPPDDVINTPFEYGMGILLIAASGCSFAAFMYLRHMAKLRRRKGAVLPYAAKDVPMSTLAYRQTHVIGGSSDGDGDVDPVAARDLEQASYEAFMDEY